MHRFALSTQAHNYYAYRFWSTYRGLAAANFVITGVMIILQVAMRSLAIIGLGDALILLATAYWVQRGSKIAIIWAMVLWTAERMLGVSLDIQAGGTYILNIAWLGVGLLLLGAALVVEFRKKKI